MQKTSIINLLGTLFFIVFLFNDCYSQLNGDSLVYTYYPNRKLKTEGTLSHGLKTGTWRYYYPDSIISAVEHYKDDLLHGQRLTYDFKGHLLTKENWVEGVEEDSSYSYHSNGQVNRKGRFKGGLYDGEWITYHENGRIKNKGSYTLGNPHGYWTFWNEEGVKTHEGNYKNGLREGQWKLYDENNSNLQFTGDYINDIKKGTWLEYDKKGKVKKKLIY